MRERKYRVWNPEMKLMLEWDIVKNMMAELLLTESKVNIPLEFTGWHDKHGEPIFEGDKVAWEGWVRIVVWDNIKSMYVFTNNINKNEDFPLYDFFEADFEIIGNIYEIYENPELLE